MWNESQQQKNKAPTQPIISTNAQLHNRSISDSSLKTKGGNKKQKKQKALISHRKGASTFERSCQRRMIHVAFRFIKPLDGLHISSRNHKTVRGKRKWIIFLKRNHNFRRSVHCVWYCPNVTAGDHWVRRQAKFDFRPTLEFENEQKKGNKKQKKMGVLVWLRYRFWEGDIYSSLPMTFFPLVAFPQLSRCHLSHRCMLLTRK